MKTNTEPNQVRKDTKPARQAATPLRQLRYRIDSVKPLKLTLVSYVDNRPAPPCASIDPQPRRARTNHNHNKSIAGAMQEGND